LARTATMSFISRGRWGNWMHSPPGARRPGSCRH
jgi:hypothetical protein